jgi:chemotaxis protein CheY-P-specific phosphatase CheC
MMLPALDDALHQAAVTTFEQVVFLLPDTPPDERQRARPVIAFASIAFAGPATGMLLVRAGEGLLPTLAANMLGQDLDSELLQLDALGEIANIICGQIFPHLDTFRAFQQQPPQVGTIGADTVAAAGEPHARVELGLESSRVDVLLWLFAEAA